MLDQRMERTLGRRFGGAVAAGLLILGGLPAPAAANPVLTPGVWTNITPAGVNMAEGCCTERGYVGSLFVEHGFKETTFGFLGIEFDPGNRSTLYAAIDVEGMWKSTDGGSNWAQMGDPTNWSYTSTHYLDSPSLVRVDPNDSLHLYATQGVRGATLGFWVSYDGGATWDQPQSFIDGSRTTWTNDLYWMSIDPTDFNHILLTFHSPWANRSDSGVLEGLYNPSTKSWTWTPHFPPAGSSWGAGLAVNFLYHPEMPVGHANRGTLQTWLVGTQGGGGYWRTEDAGTTWTNVTTQPMMHGGCSVYFTPKSGGVLYSGALYRIMRSTDNGKSWTFVGPPTADGYYAIIGDGNVLYAQPSNTGSHSVNDPAVMPFIVSAEDDGLNWTDYNIQTFIAGPYTMRFDAANGIMYAASWRAGVWALKVLPSGQTPPPPPAAPSGLTASSPSAGKVDLSWNDNSSDEEGFAIERSNNGGASFATAGTVGMGMKVFSEQGLPGGTYDYRVRSFKSNQGLMSPPSNKATVTVAGGVDPNPGPDPQPQPQPQSQLPVPVTAAILSPNKDGKNDALEFEAGDRELNVLDAKGREVCSLSASTGSLEWGGNNDAGRPLPAGMYLARIRKSDGSIRFRKVLIVR